jgi:hypothetical protein
MMASTSEQRNPYKGLPPRPWFRLHLDAADGTDVAVELVADTGNPCAIVVSMAIMAKVKLRAAPDVQTNFGLLEGGWLRIIMPDLSLDQEIEGYASDAVVTAAKNSSSDFEGLAGLPFLRLLQYGGNAASFWLRPALRPP